jgi:glycosyltransferase involved in cell wall biosynthesis
VWVGLWVKVFSFLRILPKIKVSLTVHYVFGLEGFFSKQLHKLGFLLFDGVVFVTNDVNFTRFYPKPKGLVRVIHNGIKFVTYSPRRRNAKLEKNSEIRFGVLSRLVPERNVIKAIKIFDIFFNSFSEYNSTLIIGGEGPQRRELELFCSKLPSAKQINFAGLVLDKEEFFNHIDIFLTLSDGQYPGLSGLEAIARAVPTIGYSLITDLEQSNSLVCSSNETILAQAIYNLMSKEGHLAEYTLTQYQKYATQYNLDRMIREYEVFFHLLCRLNTLS